MVTTIAVWLLVSFAASGNDASGFTPGSVVERFGDEAECRKVEKFMNDNAHRSYSSSKPPRVACILTRVVPYK